MSNCPGDKRENRAESPGPDRPANVPFFLSLHFFYFGDQTWHPHRRLIFNYGAADSRTRNTFIATPKNTFENPLKFIRNHRDRIMHVLLFWYFLEHVSFLSSYVALLSSKIFGDDFVTRNVSTYAWGSF